MTVDERVEAGANWLDEVFPDGWIDKIDLDDLDMESSCSCILGQLVPDDPWFDGDGKSYRFWSWIIHMQPMIPSEVRDRVPAFIDTSTAAEYGFLTTGRYTKEDSWNTLQEEWTKLIEKERGSK